MCYSAKCLSCWFSSCSRFSWSADDECCLHISYEFVTYMQAALIISWSAKTRTWTKPAAQTLSRVTHHTLPATLLAWWMNFQWTSYKFDIHTICIGMHVIWLKRKWLYWKTTTAILITGNHFLVKEHRWCDGYQIGQSRAGYPEGIIFVCWSHMFSKIFFSQKVQPVIIQYMTLL